MEDKEMIKNLIQKARVAQALIADYSQEQIDDVVLAVAWEVYNDENILNLAQLAVEETGMGNVEDKVKKHKGKVLGVVKDVKGAKSVGIVEFDEAKGITKYAKPVGVVGALCPITNPTATPSSNTISILKGRNAVIFAPHPHSKKCSQLTIEYMRAGLRKVGAPEDLIQIIEEPSIEATGILMKEVDLILATGGGAMVKAAYSSGTPAYGVGPGNSVQIIAEDADVIDAMKKVALSKTFDNATSCSSENSIIVHESIYDQAMEVLIGEGGALLNKEEKEVLKDWMWQINKQGYYTLNPAIIAKSAKIIAEDAGLSQFGEPRMLMVEGELPVEEDKFSVEKLSPVLTVWKYSTFDEALDILVRLTTVCGTGHSCGIHTHTDEYIHRLGMEMKTSRIMVNQPQAPANGGNFFNGMPSTVTLGCGTWGGNITTENINYKHFLNLTWVSRLIPVVKPTDDEMWGDFFAKYGK